MDIGKDVLLLPLCFWGLYLILEASDWGLCLAAPLVSRNREENEAILGLLRPGLDGNECWFVMGFFMLSAALPDVSGGSYRTVYTALAVLVGIGAVLRFFASFCRSFFSQTVMMRLLGLHSVISLGLIGLLASSALFENGELLTAMGICCAAWVVLACFQIGTIYGACKVIQPLAERFRAAFLISCVLSAVAYILFASLLKNHVGELWKEEGYFWMLLIASSILFCISFFFARMRQVEVGMIAAYISSFFAIAVYFYGYASIVPILHAVDVQSLKSFMEEWNGTMFLGIAVVWSMGSFIWRQSRKKQTYTWVDHI